MRKLLGLMGLMGIMGILSIMPINSIQAQSPADSAFQHFLDSIDANYRNPRAKGNISFNLDGAIFFINDEYFGQRIEGYTLPGFRLVPKIQWNLSWDVSLQGGLHWLNYWGAHSYPATTSYGVLPNYSDTSTLMHVVPWLQAKYHATNRLTLTFGSLDPSTHMLPLPLYNPELTYVADPEQGLEAEVKLPWLKGDVWVDWREFIWNQSPRQERFTMGASGCLRLFCADWHFYMPLHFIGQHVGGQTLATTTPIQNNFNASAGLGVSRPLPHSDITADLSCRLMWYHQQGNTAVPFNNGWGVYPELSVYFPIHWYLSVSYWTGHNFVPLLGSWLYSNLSSVDGTITFDRTDVLTAQLVYSHHPWGEDYALKVYASAYYYPLEQQLQYAIGCSFGFSPSIYLK